MRLDSTIKLILVTQTRNAFGALVNTEAETEILCAVQSVGRSDFYQAMQNGLALDLVFVINPVNYSGEKFIEYSSKRYEVTRTYQSDPDTLYLYAGEAVGAYGSDATSQQDSD